MAQLPAADKITWREVSSSNVAAVGWDRAKHMFVMFHGNSMYMYEGVSRQRTVACVRAKSVGQYINKIIKPNFDAVKVV
jgi:hypothetical protein